MKGVKGMWGGKGEVCREGVKKWDGVWMWGGGRNKVEGVGMMRESM